MLPGFYPKIKAAELRALIRQSHRAQLDKAARLGTLSTTIMPDPVQTHILSFLTKGQKSAYSKISKKANELIRVTDKLEKFVLYLYEWIKKPYDPRHPWADSRSVMFAFITDTHKLIIVTLDKYTYTPDRLSFSVSSYIHGQEEEFKIIVSKTDAAAIHRVLRSIANIYRYCSGKLHRSSPDRIRQQDVRTAQDRAHVGVVFNDALTKSFPQIQRLLVRKDHHTV